MIPPGFPRPVFPAQFAGPEPDHDFFPRPLPGIQHGLPVGAVIAFPGEILQQTGKLTAAITDLRYMPWMICDGSALLISEYPELFRVIGMLYGKQGEDHFLLPDYRGYFLRGVDLGHLRDPDARTAPPGPAADPGGVGSTQMDALQDHQHDLTISPTPVTAGEGPLKAAVPASSQTGFVCTTDGSPRVSQKETRAINIAVNWLIKTK